MSWLSDHYANRITSEDVEEGKRARAARDVDALRKAKVYFDGMGDSDQALQQWMDDARSDPKTDFRRALDDLNSALNPLDGTRLWDNS